MKALRDVFWGSLGILLGKTSHELWQVPEETPAPITELASSQLGGILLGISGVPKGRPRFGRASCSQDGVARRRKRP